VAKKLTIGLSLSLSGPYAMMGRQAEAALRLFVADVNATGAAQIAGLRHEIALECIDDEGKRGRAAEIYRELINRHVDVLFGPYSSTMARGAAPVAEQAGMLFVNHGGADDDLYRRGYRLIVGVLTPASEYMTEFVRLAGTLKLWRKRLAIVSSAAPFAGAVVEGAERACTERLVRRRGVRLRVKYNGRFEPEKTGAQLHRVLRRNRVNVLMSAGSYAHDLAVMRFATSESLNIPMLGCVAAGVNRFFYDMGHAGEGVVGTAQWEPDVEVRPTLGPTPLEFVRRMRAAGAGEPDYPAAQAYAAGLLTLAATRQAESLNPRQIREAFSDLRVSTFFGDFAIDQESGRQLGHKMVLVQWHAGRKVIINPEPDLGSGELEFPSGWRLLLAALQMLRITRHDEGDGEEDEGRNPPEM
jgi:branched-chain amino acid transport system substrate-binding protein